MILRLTDKIQQDKGWCRIEEELPCVERVKAGELVETQ